MIDEEMSIGEQIDTLYEARQKRLALEKQVEALKREETQMRQSIMIKLDEIGLAKASGNLATSGITTKVVPEVEDWDEVYRFIVFTTLSMIQGNNQQEAMVQVRQEWDQYQAADIDLSMFSLLQKRILS